MRICFEELLAGESILTFIYLRSVQTINWADSKLYPLQSGTQVQRLYLFEVSCVSVITWSRLNLLPVRFVYTF